MRALRALLDVVSLVGFALVTNDLWDMAPRAATRLARWSARCRYGATERGIIRAAEFAEVVEKTPGSVLKLVRALSFVAWAVATRAWASARRTTTAPKVAPQAVLVGAAADGPGGDLRPPVDRSGRVVRTLGALATGLGAVTGVVGYLGGMVVLAATVGPDVSLVYDSGDEPASPSIICYRFACSQDDTDTWELTAGSPVTTTYRPAGRHRVDTLSGRLWITSSCDEASVSWALTADGAPLAHGVLATGSEADLTDVEVPSGRTPAELVLTADLRSPDDCTAEITWHYPGFESPGFLPAW